MITLDVHDNKFLITATEMERDLVMKVNGLTASGSTAWTAPLRWAIYVDAASTVLRFKGTITDAAKQWGNEEGARIKALIERKNATADREMLGEVNLFPEQVADGRWLLEYDAGSGLLFSDMRTGKTFTIGAAIDNMEKMSVETSEPFLDPWPVLFVCPPGTTFEARRAFARAFPDRRMEVLSNGMTATQRKKAIESKPDILIMGYNLLAKHTKLSYYGGIKADQRAKEIKAKLYDDKELNAIQWGTVIADEIHNIKDPKSQQSRGWWYLGDRARHRLGATGTPTSKKITDKDDITKSRVNISDLWAILRAIYPLDFPAKSKFMDKYLHLDTNYFGIMEVKGMHPENEKYWQMIWEPMYIRRLRNINTVKDYRKREVELSPKQMKLYKQMTEDNMAETGGEFLVAPDSMTLRHRQREICAGMPVITNGEVKSLSEPSSKLESLLEWLDESEHKAIVFTASIPSFNLIEEKLLDKRIKFVSFPGGLKDDEKIAVTDSFNKNDETKVILCAIKATNAGIDLSAAKRLLYFNLSDDPVEMMQSEDRGLGPTQTIDVFEVTYLIAIDTFEEEQFENFVAKEINGRMLFGEQSAHV